jgi:predicted lipoprotein with Yx(FWY)xxD motif
MRHPRIIIASIAVAAVAAVGGATAATAGSPPARSTAPASAGAAAATVRTAPASVGGRTETILVSGQGLPLYFYWPDTATRSLVTGGLARLWPPLTSAAPTAVGAVGKLTAVNDAHGRQVAYNGHLLYTFTGDRPGQVSGQGFQNFFVATPGLAPAASSHAGAGPAAGGLGY